MSKRYYYPNQTVKAGGFDLSITTNGVVYHDRPDGMRRLDSLWQPRTRTLTVFLPDGEKAKIKASKEGLKVIGADPA